ncbi:tetratricopeptide repeat protein [Pseudoalteromonas sp. T1lg65]|uniref:tetratricopeptide repeat protein n=1 Tax=Pseudoalteromonas sp. T1lg65 TaxID=2077101 RepID=UPI003F797127
MKNLRLGNWIIEPELNQISQCIDGDVYTLTPKVMKLLLVLVESDAKPLSIDEIVELVWKPKIVSDNSVYQAIAQLRKILNTDPQFEDYIERISGQGYRISPTIVTPQTQFPELRLARKFKYTSLLIATALTVITVVLAILIYREGSPATQQQQYFDELSLAKHLSHSTEPKSLERAKSIYQQVLSKQSDSLAALSGLCNTYMELSVYGDVSEFELLSLCRPLLEKAESLNREHIEVITSLARFAMTEENLQLAGEYFQRGFEVSQTHPRLWHWYGRYLRDQGKVEEALAAHQNAYRLAPNDPVIIRGFAYAYLTNRKLDEARRYFERSVEVAPHTKNNPLYALDFYRLNANRAEQYLNWYQKNNTEYIKLYPAHQLSHVLVLLSLGRTQEALDYYQNATNIRSISKSFQLYVEAGLAWQQGNNTKALELLRQRYELSMTGNHYVMPYVLALIMSDQAAHALQIFERHFSAIKNLEAPVIGNEGQYLTYAMMLKLAKQQEQLGSVVHLLEIYRDQQHVIPDALLPFWYGIKGDTEKQQQSLKNLFAQGWLPDYNDSFFSQHLYLLFINDEQFKQQWRKGIKERQASLTSTNDRKMDDF